MYNINFYIDLDGEEFQLASWSSEVPFLLDKGELLNFEFACNPHRLPEALRDNARDKVDKFKRFKSWDKFQIVERSQYVKTREFATSDSIDSYKVLTDIVIEYHVELVKED